MPKDDTIKKILLIGSGPIVIGQGCEFDYSGVQACKALKEEGYLVTLVNSNPATIMTDPEFADATYIEPITPEFIEKIIIKEKPDALLPTLGGQTALNVSMQLVEAGTLDKHNVRLIGANESAIKKGENRELFKKSMQKIGLEVAISEVAHTWEAAQSVAEKIGNFPLIIRPAFTLGGSGGGIAYNADEFKKIVTRGIHLSPIDEVLIEESLLGWKEYEMEVIRDRADNCVVICSIENFDPMGVHTGDSITVAPAQTLSDEEYQKMRDDSFAVIREIGVETGGSNIQFAVDPKTGRQIVIEMNPRVSRSSALASKATGFPIARIAAKLAVGYTLDELPNDITKETKAAFEPSIDYCVVKIPRFTFEKFGQAEPELTTQMKSVGEAMAIGRTFKDALQKAIRSLDIGKFGLGFDGNSYAELSDSELIDKIKTPTEHRIYYVFEAMRRNFGVEKIHEICRIDRWFLQQIQAIYKLGTETNSESLDFKRLKNFGFSDRQIGNILQESENKVREMRKAEKVLPTYRLVDTCAAEFKAFTPYYYSSYGEENESKKSQKKSVVILGGGPNRIGQGIEFDYCCVHAAFGLHEIGYETIMVNSNPETVSTDFDTSDKLFFEPLTLEDVLNICEQEKPHGVIVQFGGQTPLNLASGLARHNIPIVGTSPDSIELAEDRKRFAKLIYEIDLQQAPNGTAMNSEEALKIANDIGYPVLVRPSFVLGGRAMCIVYSDEELKKYMSDAVEVSPEKPVLIDRFLENAIEIDVDCISDGEVAVVGAIMEHIEQAGIHSGDSACVIPSISISEDMKQRLILASKKLAKSLKVKGLMNIQFAVQNDEFYVIEANPRASRTIPYVSKTIGVPLAKLAAKVMLGKTLPELGFTEEVEPKAVTVKEAIFPFNKFPGVDISLSPEMKSTGEVMGIDKDFGLAFAKSQISASYPLPDLSNGKETSFYVRVGESMLKDAEKLFRKLNKLGVKLVAEKSLAKKIEDLQIDVQHLPIKQGDDYPQSDLDEVFNKKNIEAIFSIFSGKKLSNLDQEIRNLAIAKNIPIMTTMRAFEAFISALESMRKSPLKVKPLQEYFSQ